MKSINKTMKDMNFNLKIKDQLERDFEKAILDKEFLNFISKLDIEKKEIIKYTSQLQTSFEEYKDHLTCKSFDTCQNEMKGYAYLPKVVDKKITFYYEPCKFNVVNHYDKTSKNVYYEDIPKDIINAKMKDIITTDKKRLPVIEYITSFIKNYPNDKGLYLSGSFGSGKTYIISAAFNELAKQNIKSAIIYFPDFLRNLKGSFGQDYDSRVEYIKRVKLLLIDDIGAENVTTWSRDEVLGSILQYRMQEKLPTFFTSNLSIEELERHLSITKDSTDELKAKRIIERIKYLTTNMEMISKNMRK
jgi:primosomal protein DnaI